MIVCIFKEICIKRHRGLILEGGYESSNVDTTKINSKRTLRLSIALIFYRLWLTLSQNTSSYLDKTFQIDLPEQK